MSAQPVETPGPAAVSAAPPGALSAVPPAPLSAMPAAPPAPDPAAAHGMAAPATIDLGATEPPAAGPAATAQTVTLARAQWPTSPDDPLTQLPGFVASSFSPAAAQAAQRCLLGFFGSPPAPTELAGRTGVVLASATGDIATAAAVAAAVDEGRRVPPLLFFQSNPNAVVGYLTARWGLSGPVVCTSPTGDVLADAKRSAALLIAGGDADAVLVITVTQAGPADQDHAEAELLGPRHWLATVTGDAGEGP
jgi:hypothetical protein